MTNKIENLENDDFLTVSDLPAEVRGKLGDDLDSDDLVEIDQLAGVMGLRVEEGDADAYCTAGDFRAMLAAIRQDEIAKNPYGAALVDDNITEADLPSPPVDDDGVSADVRGAEMLDLVKRGDDAAVRAAMESEEDPAALYAFAEQLEKSGAGGALKMAAMARAAELEDLQRDVVRNQSDVLTDSFDRMLRGIDSGRARGQIDDGAALR
jgi:hypothetical protein